MRPNQPSQIGRTLKQGSARRRPSGSSRPNASAVAVERAVDVLFLIAENGEQSITELSRTVGSSGSVIHRILVALTRKGMVEQRSDTERYALSWSILGLSSSLTKRTNLRTASLPFMIDLRDLTGETVCLGVRVGFQRMAVEQVESLHEVRWVANLGARLPLHMGATGKALLAYMNPTELPTYLSNFHPVKLTPDTITDPDVLRRELENIRRRGVAISTNDRIAGLGGISAPIFDGSGAAIAVLTIAGRAERLSPSLLKNWAAPLIDATSKISRLMGQEGGGPPPAALSS
jgi:DNA-binding IclR family transcriptional regulator